DNVDLTGARISTIGKWTVVLHLTRPDPDLATAFTDLHGNFGAVMEPKCIKRASKADCGAGAYMVDWAKSISGSKWVFVPNPYYYDKSKQRWSKIVVLNITTPSTMLQAMQSGQLDVAAGDPTTAAAASAAGFTVVKAPNTNIGVFFNPKTGPPALSNVLVRQAMNYAV